jgi:hypothetical protein
MMTKAVSQMLRRLRWTDRFVSTIRSLTPSIERRRPWEARSRTISLSARAADIASAPSLSWRAIETISSVNAACTSSCACNLWHVADALKRFLCSLRLQNKRRPPALSISSEQEGMKAQKSTRIRANLGVLSSPLNALEHVARACGVPLSLNRTHDNEWCEWPQFAVLSGGISLETVSPLPVFGGVPQFHQTQVMLFTKPTSAAGAAATSNTLASTAIIILRPVISRASPQATAENKQSGPGCLVSQTVIA